MTKVYQDETIGKIEFAYNGWTGALTQGLMAFKQLELIKEC